MAGAFFGRVDHRPAAGLRFAAAVTTAAVRRTRKRMSTVSNMMAKVAGTSKFDQPHKNLLAARCEKRSLLEPSRGSP